MNKENYFSEKAHITVVLPIHNEEANITKLVQELDNEFHILDEEIFPPFLLFVDDGSVDDSVKIISQVIARRGNACCLRLSRNFGHQVAVMAGLAYIPDGSIALIMDSDGQDPPIVGVELVRQIINGVDIAYAVRKKRYGTNLWKKSSYLAFYRLLTWLSSIDIPLDAGDFCAYSAKTVSILAQMNKERPYVRGLRAWLGFKQVGIPYDRPDRYAGNSSYDLIKLFKLACDGIFSFSVLPLRLSLIIGIIVFAICIIMGLFYAVCYFLNASFGNVRIRNVPGFTTLIITLFAFNGLQMIILGIIGEYLGRLFEQSKSRPLFIISEILGNLSQEKK